MDFIENIARRWHPEWNGRMELARLGREVPKVVRLLNEIPAKRVELAKDGKLTAKGLDEAARDYYAAHVVPDLRRTVWETEKTVTEVATRRARLFQIEYDKADIAGALLRQEMRAQLRSMSEGERANAIISDPLLRAAACEGPAMLSGFTEDARAELKRRILLEAHPQQAAQLDEAEEAVAVANAAINMAAAALQTAAGFDGNESAFEHWMAASSASVEREIAAAKAKPEGSQPTPTVQSEEQLRADVGREIDRIFAEAFPTLFKTAA